MLTLKKNITSKEFFKINELVAKTSPMRSHYNSTNLVERWLWSQKKRVIKSILNRLKIKTIIDLGCGDGGLIETINHKVRYTGIDISPTQVASAKDFVRKNGRKNTKIYKGDVTKLDFSDNSFDVALVCDIVEHILSPEKLFSEVKRVVKRDGYIIFSIPNELLLQIIRILLLRFPPRSPDHLHAIFRSDIHRRFSVLKEFFLPFRFSSQFSLIRIFLVKNIKK